MKKITANVGLCVLCLTAIFFSTAVGNTRVKKPHSTLVAIRFNQVKLEQTSIDGFSLVAPIASIQSIVAVSDRPRHIARKLPLSAIDQLVFPPSKKKVAGVYRHTNVVVALDNKKGQPWFFKVEAYRNEGGKATWMLRNINLSSREPASKKDYIRFQGPIQLCLQTNLFLSATGRKENSGA
jgi:hypothetical protein